MSNDVPTRLIGGSDRGIAAASHYLWREPLLHFFLLGMLIFGVISVLGAITVLAWPQMSLVTLTVVVGIWLLAALSR